MDNRHKDEYAKLSDILNTHFPEKNRLYRNLRSDISDLLGEIARHNWSEYQRLSRSISKKSKKSKTKKRSVDMKIYNPINAAIVLVSNEVVKSGTKTEDDIYRELCVNVIQEMPIDQLKTMFHFYSGHYNPPLEELIASERGNDMNYYRVVLKDPDIQIIK